MGKPSYILQIHYILGQNLFIKDAFKNVFNFAFIKISVSKETGHCNRVNQHVRMIYEGSCDWSNVC